MSVSEIEAVTQEPQQDLAEARRLLQSVFGYKSFRFGQEAIIRQVLAGGDTQVLLPTGGGKSLCYQLPALLLPGLTIVVSPLVSLMDDQVAALQALGIPSAAIHSGMQPVDVMQTFRGIHAGEIKLLYLAPERVLQPHFLERLQEVQVSLIAVDEAHCISQWGHDFRPEYGQLGTLRQWLPQVPILALTATADSVTRADIAERLQLREPRVVQGSFDRANIRYLVQEKFSPQQQVADYVLKQRGASGIIYCGSRKRTEELAEKLMREGVRAAAYHAGLAHDVRQSVLYRFLRDDLDVVVATVAFGMGINKPNVRFVLHYDLPRSIEAYYQETGRAGRDGAPAEAVMFYEPGDARWIWRLLEEHDETPQLRVEKQKFHAMTSFAEAQTCRRLVLLNYFGEYRDQACGNCDLCLDPPKQYDGTVDAQKALSCVYRTGQQFGVQHVVDVLRGSHNQKVKQHDHEQISTFGIGKDKSPEHWVSVLRQLIHRGLLAQDIRLHSALQLTEAARPVLRGEIALTLAEPRLAALSKTELVSDRGQHDKALFRKLKALRKNIAERDGVPPFVVFSDATLQEMALLLPTSASEMLAVSGVGQVKLDRYGLIFIEAIGNYLAENPIPQ
ncbi:DNA helicase RecQ [Aliidiomarina celeris]|uniref:DNA helicase RecQ n=1 Tax=Aliidiomarina celeris TaxID=2249428 RepID=UPI000DEAC462|nr:DNA helicase RecQ [Aliidiomarina celeris]